jgi:methyl-accepting chemotaxis protein
VYNAFHGGCVNTKLDRSFPSYQALMQKRSYTGEAIIFGRTYDTYYAPLINEEGKLNGAIFVGNQR